MSAYGDPTRTLTRSGITYADLGLADDDAPRVSRRGSHRAGVRHRRPVLRPGFALHEDVAERYDGSGPSPPSPPRLADHLRDLGRGRRCRTRRGAVDYRGPPPGGGILERVDGAVWPAGAGGTSWSPTLMATSRRRARSSASLEDLVVWGTDPTPPAQGDEGASSDEYGAATASHTRSSPADGAPPEQAQILDGLPADRGCA